MAIGTAAAIIGSSVVGAVAGSRASSRAADAQAQASNNAISSQERMLERMLGISEPARQFGNSAMNELSQLFGYGGQQQMQPAQGMGRQFAGGRTMRGGYGGMQMMQPKMQPAKQGRFDPSVFIESPDYKFRQSQGLEGIAQTLGAGGQGAFSGNALRGMNEFNSNLASGEFGNFVNRRLAMAGMGQSANFQAQDAMGNAGNNIGNAMMNQGNARASGILGSSAAINNGMNGILQSMILKDAGLVG